MAIDYTPKSKIQKFPKFSRTHKYTNNTPVSVIKSGYNPRETVKLKSMVTEGGSTTLKPKYEYTGSEMVGISIIHKSCLQPIFNQQSAIDAASMRR